MREWYSKIRNSYIDNRSSTKYYLINKSGEPFFYHRKVGPSIISKNVSEWVAYNSETEFEEYHRTDGPAINYKNGYISWWFHDIELTEEMYWNE